MDKVLVIPSHKSLKFQIMSKLVDTIDSKSTDFGRGSSSLPGATTLYRLITTDEYGNEDQGGKAYIMGLMKSSALRLIKGHPLVKEKDLTLGHQRLELSQRIKDNQILESDLFHLKQYINGYYPQMKSSYKFLPSTY